MHDHGNGKFLTQGIGGQFIECARLVADVHPDAGILAGAAVAAATATSTAAAAIATAPAAIRILRCGRCRRRFRWWRCDRDDRGCRRLRLVHLVLQLGGNPHAERIVGHHEHVGALGDDDVGGRGHAGLEQQVGVVDVDDDRERDHAAGVLGEIAHLGYDALKGTIEVGIHRESHGLLFLHAADVRLGYIRADLEGGQVVDDGVKRDGRLVHVHRGADIDCPVEDDAIDGRVDYAAIKVGLGIYQGRLLADQVGFGLGERGDGGVVVRLGDQVLLEEVLGARRILAGLGRARRRGGEICLGLRQFLVVGRRVDLEEPLALFDDIVEIRVDGDDVAGDLAADRHLGGRLQVAGGADRLDDVTARNLHRRILGLLAGFLVPVIPAGVAEGCDDNDRNDGADQTAGFSHKMMSKGMGKIRMGFAWSPEILKRNQKSSCQPQDVKGIQR